MTTAWNHDGMELLTRWDQFFPPLKLFSFLYFFKEEKKRLQQINRTINFLIYLLQRAKEVNVKWQKHQNRQ